MKPATRRAWALAASSLLLLCILFAFACWVIAIWKPWGHANEWGSTGVAALFPATVFGFTALILWTGDEA